MIRGARFSRDRKYRYALWRIWDEKKDSVLFIGLNPSQADEKINDPTIRRCISFAQSHGFGSLYVVNLFSFCTAYPSKLKSADDPIGKQTNHWISFYQKKTMTHVAIWGNSGRFQDRDQQVRRKFPTLYCLEQNKSGQPKHPLYIRADQKLKLLD